MRLQAAKTDEICWRWLALRGVMFLFGCSLLSGCGGSVNSTSVCRWVFLNDNPIYEGSSREAATMSECQTICQDTPNCRGIDWSPLNPPSIKCLLHTPVGLKFSAENIFNYYLRYFSEDCQWIQYYETKISGDSRPRYKEAITIETCQFACQLTPGCQSIDWNGGCYLQYTQSGKSQTNRFTHYDFVCNRGGVCSLTFQNNTMTVYGTAMTLPDCQRACQSMVNCVRIDWARTTNKCQLRSSISSQVTTIDVEHYQPTGDCKGGCTWTTTVKTYVPNVPLVIPASNVSACQSACIQIVGCKGIDWIISEGKPCFLQQTQAGRRHEYSTHYDLQC